MLHCYPCPSQQHTCRSNSSGIEISWICPHARWCPRAKVANRHQKNVQWGRIGNCKTICCPELSTHNAISGTQLDDTTRLSARLFHVSKQNGLSVSIRSTSMTSSEGECGEAVDGPVTSELPAANPAAFSSAAFFGAADPSTWDHLQASTRPHVDCVDARRAAHNALFRRERGLPSVLTWTPCHYSCLLLLSALTFLGTALVSQATRAQVA